MAAWGGALELEGSLRSGSIEWPSPADLITGTPHQSRAQVDVYVSGSLFWEGDVTSEAVGDGTANVTVPAGNFDTVVLSHTWTFSPRGEGPDSKVSSVLHSADGIGMVKAEVNAGAPSSA